MLHICAIILAQFTLVMVIMIIIKWSQWFRRKARMSSILVISGQLRIPMMLYGKSLTHEEHLKKKFCKVTKRLIVSQPPWTGECGPCPRPWSISSSSSSASSLSSATGGPPGTTGGLRISALETGPGSSSWWRRAGRSCSNVSRTWLTRNLKMVRKFSWQRRWLW